MGEDLDIASWDSYPIGFLSDRLEADEGDKATYLRQGDPDNQALHHDLYRAVGRGRWWVMEQHPARLTGPPGTRPLCPEWRAYGMGSHRPRRRSCLLFPLAPAPFAQEQNHAGLLRPDSVAAPALAEAAQVAKEIKDFGPIIQPKATSPSF